MWVVKIGGSLNSDPLLPQWLELLAQLGGGRVTLVCGGGAFADAVRSAHSHWHFDELAAHNMAVLAMTQSSYMAHALQPSLQLARDTGEIHQVLRAGHTALWQPYEWLRDRPGPDTGWDTTSDSIALDLARRLNAERMVVVKSCAIDPVASFAALGEQGVLDRRFAAIAAGANFPIDLIHRAELARMRSLLIGEVRLDA